MIPKSFNEVCFRTVFLNSGLISDFFEYISQFHCIHLCGRVIGENWVSTRV